MRRCLTGAVDEQRQFLADGQGHEHIPVTLYVTAEQAGTELRKVDLRAYVGDRVAVRCQDWADSDAAYDVSEIARLARVTGEHLPEPGSQHLHSRHVVIGTVSADGRRFEGEDEAGEPIQQLLWTVNGPDASVDTETYAGRRVAVACQSTQAGRAYGVNGIGELEPTREA